MPRPSTHLVLTPEQAQELQAFLNEMTIYAGAPGAERARRRALVLWYSYKHSWSVPRLSRHFGIPERTIWRWFKDYRQLGVNGLIDQRLRETIPDWRGLETMIKPRPGRPNSLQRQVARRRAIKAAATPLAKPPAPPASRIMTPSEAADYLRISRPKLYRLVRDGKLPAFKLGRTWRFRYADLYQFLVQQTREYARRKLMKPTPPK